MASATELRFLWLPCNVAIGTSSLLSGFSMFYLVGSGPRKKQGQEASAKRKGLKIEGCGAHSTTHPLYFFGAW